MYIVQTNKNEKDDTHVTPMWPSSTYAYKHYILFPYDTIYCCCFVIFGLTTNTNEMYQSVNLSIVEMDAVAGVGTRIGFSYSGPGNSSFVWPRISRPPIDRFWPNFQRWKKTISATARRSLPLLQFAVPPLGDRKGKRFPKFLENGKADRHHSGTVRKSWAPWRNFWNMPLLLFGKVGEGYP